VNEWWGGASVRGEVRGIRLKWAPPPRLIFFIHVAHNVAIWNADARPRFSPRPDARTGALTFVLSFLIN
jgi:hypothetical protein